MKKLKYILLIACFTICNVSLHAQSWKDLFNPENVSKAISAVTGDAKLPDMVGSWDYNGSAIEFKSDELLKKAGGRIAASRMEKELNEQLQKLGVTPGMVKFTFNEDNTFTAVLGKNKLSGTYSYNTETKRLNLVFAKVFTMDAAINLTGKNMKLLFDADKLLLLVTFLSGNSNNTTLQKIGTLAQQYDGMQVGLEMRKL